MEKLSWMFELLDKMSGPANKIATSLKKLDPPMKSTSQGAGLFARSIGFIGRTFGPAASGAVLRFAGAATSLAQRLAPLGPVMGAVGRAAGAAGSAGFSILGKGAMLAAGAVAAVAVAAVAGVGLLAVTGAKFVLSAAMFKEDSLAAFSAMSGSDEAAKRIFAKATAFASKTPFKTSEVVNMAQALMSRGFKEGELDKLMMGAGDVGALLGTEKMASVINALGKIRSNGKMTGESLEMLADAGINSQLVFASLEKQLGKTKPELVALMSAGKITDAQAIQATMDAIANGLSGGKLGGAMEKKSKTLSGIWSTFQSVPEDLMAVANVAGFMDPLKDFVKKLSELLSPESAAGKRILALIETVGGGVGELFKSLNAQDLAAAIGKVLDVVEPLVKMAMGAGKGFFGTLLKVFIELGKHMGTMTPDQITKLVEAMIVMGQISAVVLTIIVTLAAALLALPFAMIMAANAIWEELSSLADAITDPAKWQEVGISIIKGIITGMLSMSSPFSDMFNRVTGTDKMPSMIDMLTGNEAGGAAASVLPGGGGIAPAVGTAPTIGAGGVGQQQITVQTGDINVNAAEMGDDPKSHGKAAAGSFKDKLASELNNLGLSFGG